MTTTTDRPARRLAPTTRKWLLLSHIVASVGWLGLNVANLTLAITGLVTADPVVRRAAFGAMYLIGGPLLVPVSLLAFVSGLLLGLYSKWGVFRYRWVLVKFALTAIAMVLVPLSLLPGLRDLAALVAGAPEGELVDVGRLAWDMLSAGIVSTGMYVMCTALSVLKPWGRTRRVH